MGRNELIGKVVNNKISDILGKFTIYTFFISFFIWTGGLKYSVWFGLIALMIKKIKYKEEIKIGPKILAYSNLYIFFGTLLIDILTFKNTNNIGAYDRYNIFLMYFVLVNFINSKKELDRLILLFGISALISYTGAIPNIKILLKDPTFRVESFYDIMSFSHALATGSIFFLGMFLFNSSGKYRFFYGMTYSFAVIMVFLTQTRGAILATISAQFLLILYILITKRKVFLLVVLLILTFSFAHKFINGLERGFGNSINRNASNQLRIIFWKGSIYGFKKNPLLGSGFRGTGELFKEYLIETNQVDYVIENYSGGLHGNSHNDYLASLMRFGLLVGGYIILYLIVIIPWVYIKNYKKINQHWRQYYIFLPFTFFSFYVSGLTENVLVSKIGNIFIVSLSIMALSIMKSGKIISDIEI